MKPHSLRRVLWLVNVVLAVAVVGVLAWFIMKVRPAVAEDTGRPAKFQPAEYKAMRKEYESLRVTGLQWTPKAPVSDEELTKVVLRKDYERRKPSHFIFTGPMPPPIVTDTGPKETGPPPPKGLEALGQVVMVFLNPPDKRTITFKFNGGKPLPFSEGDFVVQSRSDRRRFKITKIAEKERGVFTISYAVYGSDPDKPEGEGEMVTSLRKKTTYDFLRPMGPRKPTSDDDTASTAAGGTDPGSGTAAGAGAKPGGKPSADDGAKTGDGNAPTRVIQASKPTQDLTVADLRPEVIEVDRSRRIVKFDDNSYRYFRGKKAGSLVETVKTDVAVDRQTGRKIGLRITGWEKDAPADLFKVRRGDILVSINGQKVLSRSDAIRVIEKLNPEALVTVVIDRNGRLITYKVDPTDPKTRRQVRYFDNLR